MALAGFVSAGGQSGSSGAVPVPANTTDTRPAHLFPLQAPAGVRHAVSIQNLAYNPATVSVKVGDTVQWTNNDDRDHTVKADDGSFSSPNLGPGQTFEHKFTSAGTVQYGCNYHPRMRGSVTVTQ